MVWRICKHVQCINVNTMLINCLAGDFLGLSNRYMFKDVSDRFLLGDTAAMLEFFAFLSFAVLL